MKSALERRQNRLRQAPYYTLEPRQRNRIDFDPWGDDYSSRPIRGSAIGQEPEPAKRCPGGIEENKFRFEDKYQGTGNRKVHGPVG
jgi:hypothetical protein